MVPNFLPILRWPNDDLNVVCSPVETFDEELEQFALDLFATMKQNNGIGLAAPQVGRPVRLFALWLENNTPLFIANPEILEVGKDLYKWEEGCLSVPGYFEERERPQKVIIRYQDIKGEIKETEFQGLYAFAVQHEMDHLDGKVFVDGAGMMKTRIIKGKIKKFLKNR